MATWSIKHGYQHALATACPGGAHAPAVFWPLVVATLVLSAAAFAARPGRRADGRRTRAGVFALFVVIAAPLATLGLVIGFEIGYACWE